MVSIYKYLAANLRVRYDYAIVFKIPQNSFTESDVLNNAAECIIKGNPVANFERSKKNNEKATNQIT